MGVYGYCILENGNVVDLVCYRHSFFNNCAATEASSRPPEDFMMAFPLSGTIARSAGLFSLVRGSWQNHIIWSLIVGFLVITGAFYLFGAVVVWHAEPFDRKMTRHIFAAFTGVLCLCVGAGVLAALYSDWVAAIVDNYAGIQLETLRFYTGPICGEETAILSF